MHEEEMPRRHGGDFWSDLGDPNKWVHELTDPNSNLMRVGQTAAQLGALAGAGRGYGPRRRGGDFWSDLGDPNKWVHELTDPNSNLMRVGQTAAQLGALAAGRPRRRRGGDFWSDLGNPNKWVHELTDPNSNLMRTAQTASQLAALAGAGRGYGRTGGRAPSRRGAIVRQVMAQHRGMSLPEASRYVKQHGLYK